MLFVLALVLLPVCTASSFGQSAQQAASHTSPNAAATNTKPSDRFCGIDKSLADELTTNRYATDSGFLYIGLIFIAALTYIYCSNRSEPGPARYRTPVMFLGFALGLIVYASTSIWIYTARNLEMKQNIDNYRACVKSGGNP